MRLSWILLIGAILAAPGPVLAEETRAGEEPDDTWWVDADPDWWADGEDDWWTRPPAEGTDGPPERARPTALLIPPAAAAAAPESPPEAETGALEEEEEEAARRRDYNECRRLPRQIERFKTVDLELARERGDEVWEKSTEDHIARLEARYEDQCVVPENLFAKLVDTFVVLGRIAMTVAQAMSGGGF